MPAANSNTIYGIINDAMFDAGLLQKGEIANSEDLETNSRRLCDLINLWQTQGLKLFFLQDLVIPLVVSQSEYLLQPTLGAVDMTKPMRIIQAYMLNTTGLAKRPLTALSWNEWINLSQTAGNVGAISSYFVDKQSTSLKVHVWQTPDAAEILNTLHVLIQVQAAFIENLEESMVFPQEWRIALRWGLADDIATGQPQAIMDRCAERSVVYRELLEDWDIEDTSTRFAIGQRSGYNTGGFS